MASRKDCGVSINRRTYLAGSGTAAIAGLGGCLGDEGGSDGNPDDGASDDGQADTDDGGTAGDTSNGTETVRISSVPVVGTLPFYVGMEEGYFEERGIEMEITRTEGGAQATSQMATGELDGMGGGIGASTVNLMLEDADVSVVADRARNRPNMPNSQAFVIAGHAYEEGMTVGDTAGMTWGNNGVGNINEFMIARALEANGQSIDDIEMETMPFPQMISALEEGAIDVAATVAGFIPQSIDASDGALLAYTAKYNAPTQVGNVVFGDRFIDERGDTAVKALEGILLGQRKVYEEGFYSDYNAEIWEQYTDNPPEVLRSTPVMWWDRNGEVLGESLVRQQEFWECRGYSDGVVPQDELVNRSLTEEALDEIGRVENGLPTDEEYESWKENMIVDLPETVESTPPETEECGGAGEVEVVR